MGNQLQPISEVQPWHSILRDRRERLRKSASEMSKLLSCSPALWSHVEGRTKPCPLALAMKLCNHFACEIEDLFGSDGYALTLRDSEEYSDGQLSFCLSAALAEKRKRESGVSDG